MSLSKTREVDLPRDSRVDIDSTTDDGKRVKKVVARNNLAIANVNVAFATSGLIHKAHKARAVENPGGLVHLLVTDLLKECQPKDRTNKVEAKVKLLNIKMKSGCDPK